MRSFQGRSGRSIIRTNAVKGEGVAELVDQVEKMVASKDTGNGWHRQRVMGDVDSLIKERLEVLASFSWAEVEAMKGFIGDILAGRADPYALKDGMIVRCLEEMLDRYGG